MHAIQELNGIILFDFKIHKLTWFIKENVRKTYVRKVISKKEISFYLNFIC